MHRLFFILLLSVMAGSAIVAQDSQPADDDWMDQLREISEYADDEFD